MTWPCCTRITGEYAKAEPLYPLRVCRRFVAPSIPTSRLSLGNLGTLYQDMGEFAKAEPLLQEALRIRQKVLGQNFPTRRTASIDWPDCTGI